MKERSRKPSLTQYLVRLSLTMLFGTMVGAALSASRPPQFVAEAAVYFPALNSQLYAQLTQALRADPLEQETSASSFVTPPATDTQELALMIFRSRAAANYCLSQTGSASKPTWWNPDPVERFRTRQLAISTSQSRGLQLKVTAGSPELARQLCEALINYYSAFVKDNPLTVTATTRKKLEAELAFQGKKLDSLEREMLGTNKEAAAGQNTSPQVARELYRRRIDQGSQGRAVLDTLHRIREQRRRTDPSPQARNSPAPLDTPNWNEQWDTSRDNSKRDRPGEKFGSNVRSEDLLKRAQLERRYEDNLLLYRSLLLQSSFLRTWESLETDRLEILDPIAVRSADRVNQNWAMIGGITASLAWLLLSLLRWRR